MRLQSRARRRLAWGFVTTAVGLAIGCSSASECDGPGGLCIELPDQSQQSGRGGGAASIDEAGAPSAPDREGSGGTVIGSGGSGPGSGGVPAVAGSSPIANAGRTSAGGTGAGAGTGTGGAPGQGGVSGVPFAGTGPAAGAPTFPGSDCLSLPALPVTLTDWFHTFLPWPAPALNFSGLPCPTRPEGAKGGCYGLQWSLAPLEQVGATLVELDVKHCASPSGTSAITFQARGYHGGEVVTFGALGTELTNQTLTQAWQAFRIDLSEPSWPPSEPLPDLFYVVTTAGAAATTPSFFVDDLQWISTGHCEPPLDLPATCDEVVGQEPEAAAGAGGTGSCEVGAGGMGPVDAELLPLDDFEDGDEQSLMLESGRGHWTSYNDGSMGSYQYPEPCPKPSSLAGPTAESAFSLLTYGCGANAWGAGVQLVMNSADGCSESLDASGYEGIQFWAQGSLRRIIVQVDTDETTPEACAPSGLPVGCTAFQSEVFLEQTWSLHRVAFSALKRAAPPNASFDPAVLIRSINWTHRPESQDQGYSFAIDDVALYRGVGTPSN